MSNEPLIQDLKQVNREFNLLKDANDIALDKVAREESAAAFGLRERISGGAGFAGAVFSIVAERFFQFRQQFSRRIP